MSIINLIEKSIYFKGSIMNPSFDQLISFNTETRDLTMKDAFDMETTMAFVLDANRFLSYDPELNTMEKIVEYLYSIDMKYNLEHVPSELHNRLELEEKEGKFNSLLNILQDINNGTKEVIIKDVETDEDDDMYDTEDSHTVTNLSGDKYIEDTESELDLLCMEVLIGNDGQPNYYYIQKLKLHGFNVFATEKDSFGWLGAAVRTNKGLIFFG